MSSTWGTAYQRLGADQQSLMTIGDLSAVTGLSISAIRFYQRRGLLPARDAESGWQRYGREAVDRLAVIELAKGAGLSLDEIIRLLDALGDTPAPDANGVPIWKGLAEAKILEIDTRIQRLRRMRGLLQDALARDGLSAERIAQVPAALDWVPEPIDGAAVLRPLPVQTQVVNGQSV